MTRIAYRYPELENILQVSEIVYTISLLEEAGNMIVSATSGQFQCSFFMGYSD